MKYLYIIGVVLALLGGGCSGDEGENGGRAELTLIVGDEPKTLDPALVTSLAAARVADSLFEGLTNLNVANPTEPLPGLAESWETADGLTYTFHLREAKWSNGDSITAADLLYSWRRVLTPATASEYVHFLFYLKNGERFYKGEVPFDQVGVRAVDARTVEVTLNQVTPHFLELTAFTTLRVVHGASVDKHATRWTRPENMVCSGPYTLESWSVNERIALKKNPAYWDAANVRIGTVDFLPNAKQHTILQQYEAGEVDFITSVPERLVDKLMTRDDFHGAQAFGTYFIRFNTAREALGDSRVRRALALTVDRAVLVEHVTRGHTAVAAGLVPPSTPEYGAIDGLGFDPERARKLLAEAGYPNGKGFPTLTYLFNDSENGARIAQVLKAGWKKELNIDVDLDRREWKIYLGRVTSGEYDLARGSWYGDYLEPSSFLDMFTTGHLFNKTGWGSPEYDALMVTSNATVDPVARRETQLKAERILVEQGVPIAPVFTFHTTNMIKPWVKGMVANPRNVIRIKDLWIDDAAKPK